MEVWLEQHQVDDPPPECPACANRRMAQEYRAPAIVGHTARSKAEKLKDDILRNDYNVADYNHDKHESTPTVRYKDQTTKSSSTWQATNEALSQAVALGRQNRLKFGSGLDILHNNIKNGTEPDLIELSKRRSPKVW